MLEICPICKGRGKTRKFEEDHPDVVIPTTTSVYHNSICHGCGGKGWVNPFGDYTYKPSPSYPSNVGVDPNPLISGLSLSL